MSDRYDEMNRIVICRSCGRPEYFGEFRSLAGKCLCRDCYSAFYEQYYGKPYVWDDLDGARPTVYDYEEQGYGL